jgi:hypothetical protein
MKKPCVCTYLGPIIFYLLLDVYIHCSGHVYSFYWSATQLFLGLLLYQNMMKNIAIIFENKNFKITGSDLFLIVFLGLMFKTVTVLAIN